MASLPFGRDVSGGGFNMGCETARLAFIAHADDNPSAPGRAVIASSALTTPSITNATVPAMQLRANPLLLRVSVLCRA
jgi:hypothetical protein